MKEEAEREKSRGRGDEAKTRGGENKTRGKREKQTNRNPTKRERLLYYTHLGQERVQPVALIDKHDHRHVLQPHPAAAAAGGVRVVGRHAEVRRSGIVRRADRPHRAAPGCVNTRDSRRSRAVGLLSPWRDSNKSRRFFYCTVVILDTKKYRSATVPGMYCTRVQVTCR
jgi:hypothetical protein